MAKVRKILLYVLIAFALYAVLTNPAQSADMVKASVDIVADGLGNVGNFFDALLA